MVLLALLGLFVPFVIVAFYFTGVFIAAIKRKRITTVLRDRLTIRSMG